MEMIFQSEDNKLVHPRVTNGKARNDQLRAHRPSGAAVTRLPRWTAAEVKHWLAGGVLGQSEVERFCQGKLAEQRGRSLHVYIYIHIILCVCATVIALVHHN